MLSKEKLKQVLKQYEIRPTKERGQNFLMDDSVIEAMVEAASITTDDLVLEIGPGIGVLTEKLSEKAGAVVAMELDKKLIHLLKDQVLPFRDNLSLLEGDALSSEVYHDFVGWLAEKNDVVLDEDKKSDAYQKAIKDLDGSYKLVANLPYQITSRIFRQFLDASPKPAELVVMVQKEVGERMMAPAGKMSKLALSVQVFAEVHKVIDVPAHVFFPAPKVHSMAIRCDLTKPNKAYAALSIEGQKLFWQLVKMGFAAKRKLLKKNLATFFEGKDVKEVFDSLAIEEKARAQELTIEQWCGLVHVLEI